MDLGNNNNDDTDEPMINEMGSINISDSNDSGSTNGYEQHEIRRRSSSTDMSEDSDDDDDDDDDIESVAAAMGASSSSMTGRAAVSVAAASGINVGAMELDDSEELDATIVKRRAIQAIHRDPTLDAQTKRFRIQQLMDGSSYSGTGSGTGTGNMTSLRRNSSEFTSATSLTGLTGAGNVARRSVSSYGIGVGLGTRTAPTDVMKCLHYEGRKCNIVAPCCGEIFGCRVCHDEMVTDGHEMNRFLVREIVCKDCHTRQERSNECIKCGITFGEYHCNICNLWMNKTKKPFHCDKCGICRVGGVENFIHCDECDMCISRNTFDNHLCLKDKFKNSCPICFENMHSSRHAALDLPCGHAIHTHCFRKLAAFDYRCPICKKTVVNSDTMSRAWAERAREIESQPMPSDLARSVDIWCNDCEVKSEGRDWHFLGVQCPNCRSFNTAVENNVSRMSESSGGGDGR